MNHENDTNQSFKSRLTELRKARGLSQRELANLVDVSANTIASWERSVHRSFVIACEIVTFFEVEIAELYGDQDPLRNIRALREISKLRNQYGGGRGITQRRLSQRLDITENTISSWEGEKYDVINKIERLCVELRCDINQLFQSVAPETQSDASNHQGSISHERQTDRSQTSADRKPKIPTIVDSEAPERHDGDSLSPVLDRPALSA
jgi:transcriptional regulator with XRE-family HTH domain